MTTKKSAAAEPQEPPQDDEEAQNKPETSEVSPDVEQTQRQMVPPQVTTKGKKYPSDPNWYPDPDKPLPRSF